MISIKNIICEMRPSLDAFSIDVSIHKSDPNSYGVSEKELPFMEQWPFRTRNQEPYVVVATAKYKGKLIGKAMFGYWGDKSNPFLKADSVYVIPYYRKMGVANLMYDKSAEFIKGIVTPSGYQTPGGKGLWKKRLSKSSINESNFSGKTYVSVDIQPAYEKAFTFKISKFCEFINKLQCDRLIFLFNGPDLGLPDENDYKYWLLENGMDEEIIDRAVFYDKGYAFFRYCMDNNLDDDVISNFVRFMYDNNIRDSRQMTREMWAKYLKLHRRTDRKEVYELLRDSADCVHIPDLMDFLRSTRNVVLTGGGVNECLKEVEIAMKALKLPYEIDKQFTY